MYIQSIIAAAARYPIPTAIIAGVITRITQTALSTIFRSPAAWISLLGRASQVPGGQAFVYLAPGLLVAAITTALLRRYNTQSLHVQVDHLIESSKDRSPIKLDPIGSATPYIFSNYPTNVKKAHDIFCDAFGYAEVKQIQIVAIADGCGRGEKSQQAARAMVDGFMNYLSSNMGDLNAKQFVMDAAADVQQQMETKNKPGDESNRIGYTTFLGGLIYPSTDGKRYFTGVNCGDTKLYLLRDDEFHELTSEARTDAEDSGGRFGPAREEKDKTEYPFSFEVQQGDTLFFMTDGVHDNLDLNPPEKSLNEAVGEAEKRKLLTLNGFAKKGDLGMTIMNSVLHHTETHVNALSNKQNMKNASQEEFVGKPDHMTLLVVKVE